jgi:hypothetical protein
MRGIERASTLLKDLREGGAPEVDDLGFLGSSGYLVRIFSEGTSA